MVEPEGGSVLADRLKDLREDSSLTQNQLGPALGVSGATISAWESSTNPKKPTAARLTAYARFFATRRSLDGPRLVAEADLTADERDRYEELEEELLGLLNPTSTAPPVAVPAAAPARAGGTSTSALGQTFAFHDGRVTVICPQAPGAVRGPLAEDNDPNFAKLRQYGDLDALIEMYGHLRAANPALDVFHRHAGEVTADDLSNHVILLGGVGWNPVTKRIQDAIRQVPITQLEVADFAGDIFEVGDDSTDAPRRFLPEWEDDHGSRDLVEDVALIVRLPNPFNGRRTLTMCNGIHSRGVYGAVRSLTDTAVREANEEYLAERFPEGRFAVLLRVPVVANETMSPDLTNPTARLYEWPPRQGEHG